MAHFTLTIEAAGPIISVHVGVTPERSEALAAAGVTSPQARIVRALVDTGASCTCIDPDVLQALNLSPTGSTEIITPSTGSIPVPVERYEVALLIPPARPVDMPLAIPAIPVVAAELSFQGHDALIGRDSLRDCVMVYNGTMGFFTLAF